MLADVKRFALLFGIAGALMTSGALRGSDERTTQETPLVVFLVRHAEKQLVAGDPQLTDEGVHRAEQLAELLRSADINSIHSTRYVRTQTTAAPLARKLGQSVQPYDPANLDELLSRLRATGGRHLVVGHSNTTPAVVQLLGGDAGSPIAEATEFDRLYIVTTAADGTVSTVLLRYGAPSHAVNSP